jgi:hypothetical protein
MLHPTWLAAVALFTGLDAAHSQSITYDFAGVGEICTAPQAGQDYVCDTDAQFTGSVMMELLAAGPAGSDSETDGLSYAWDLNGWVQTSFVIQWNDETFVPGPVPDMLTSTSETHVWNNYISLPEDPWRDLLQNSVFFPGSVCQEQAHLTRSTTDTTWLDDLDFDLSAGLAPGPGATNTLGFDIICGSDFYHRSGFVALTSFKARVGRTRVDIDIRPRARPNYISLRSRGLLAVAVLGSNDFDAAQADPRSVRFGPGRAGPVGEVRIADVNRDGYPDSTWRFRIRETGVRRGQRTAMLTGTTFAGEGFFGKDHIRVIGSR